MGTCKKTYHEMQIGMLKLMTKDSKLAADLFTDKGYQAVQPATRSPFC